MLKSLMLTALLVAGTGAVLAADTRYRIRVDGLACPYCAYGIEKKLKQIDGVEKIEVDLDQGLVMVYTTGGVELTEEQMTRLFSDAGFTYRSMRRERQ